MDGERYDAGTEYLKTRYAPRRRQRLPDPPPSYAEETKDNPFSISNPEGFTPYYDHSVPGALREGESIEENWARNPWSITAKKGFTPNGG